MKTKLYPKVTVVTVTYNSGTVLENTIVSVISQTYPNLEYIIIDGASIDSTISIIKMFEDRITRWISESDKGIYDAMNKGVMYATGEWIIFMNAGDCFVNTQTLSDIFIKDIDDDMSVIYGDVIMKYSWGNTLLHGHFFTSQDINLPFCHQSSLVKSSLIKRNLFDLNYKIAADYNLFYTFYKTGKRFEYINMPIAIYDVVGFSTNKVMETFIEVCRANGSNKGWKYKLRLFGFVVRKLIINFIPHKVVELYRKNKYVSL